MPFECCVDGTGLTDAELADPLTQIEGRQELAVVRNILEAIDPSVAFGLEAGLRYHATTHGMWGFGVISSPDLRSAIDFMLRYFDLSYSFNRVRAEYVGALVHGYYDASDNPEDLQAVLVERDLAALLTLQRDGLGRVIPTRSLQLRAAKPAYDHAFESLFGVTPQYNAEVNCITAEAKYLSVSEPLADDAGRALVSSSAALFSGVCTSTRASGGRCDAGFCASRARSPACKPWPKNSA